MIINRLFVTGYKNLINCNITPRNVHAITGCNGAGKSNLLEVTSFVAGFLSYSDEERSQILNDGVCPNGRWFPTSTTKKHIKPFQFIVECILNIENVKHIIEYTLSFSIQTLDDKPYFHVSSARVESELIRTKIENAPGRIKTVLLRTGEGATTVFGGKSARSKNVFKCKTDMSALQALEVREADDFQKHFPVIHAFCKAISSTELVRLDSETFRNNLYSSNRRPFTNRTPGSILNSYDPYYLMQEIKKDKTQWDKFQLCLKELVNIEGLVLHEDNASDKENKSEIKEQKKYIFPVQHGRLLWVGELSMGATMAVGIITVLFTLLRKGGAAFLEEPENFLHPKAVVEIIKRFRDFSEEHTVIFSTHSPVALNSMHPKDVTVMKLLADGFVTTENVANIQEALDALNRGFLSFGDLLQTNYQSPA